MKFFFKTGIIIVIQRKAALSLKTALLAFQAVPSGRLNAIKSVCTGKGVPIYLSTYLCIQKSKW